MRTKPVTTVKEIASPADLIGKHVYDEDERYLGEVTERDAKNSAHVTILKHGREYTGHWLILRVEV